MYIVEGIGLETFVEEFDTEKQAQESLKQFVYDFNENYGVIKTNASLYEVTANDFTYGNDGEYQACFVYKKPETLKDEMLLEIQRAYYGIDQYAFELCDSGTCSGHIDALKRMIEENM